MPNRQKSQLLSISLPMQCSLVSNAPLATNLFGCFLPFLLRARMVGFDIKGEEVASGSKAALIAGIIFSLLTVLCLVMQFAVFG
jgi:hypothetical protein